MGHLVAGRPDSRGSASQPVSAGFLARSRGSDGYALHIYRGRETQSQAGFRQPGGRRFFEGRASCVLAGNVGKVLGGVEAFPEARPDDGLLELGVVTAKNLLEWARTFVRLALGRAAESRFVEVTRGEIISIRFDRKLPYELDGGTRPAVRKLRIKACPGSIKICVPPKVASVSIAAAGDEHA